MGATDVIGIVIAVVIVGVFAFVVLRGLQRKRLRERFGDEYERVVADKGRRGAAESELRQRERRHANLTLHDLTDAERARFRDGWVDVQARFVDDPVAAVRDGDRLVTELVSLRGYPTTDYEDLVSHLSVEHANVLNHYREAHEISERNDAGTATTEQLRRALVHYRELFADLLGERPATSVASVADRDAADRNLAGRDLADRDAADRNVADRNAATPVQAAPAGAVPADEGDAAGTHQNFGRANGAVADDMADSDTGATGARTVPATFADATDADEPVNGAPVADPVRSGMRGTASDDEDASAPHNDAIRRDTPPHGR